MDNETGATTIKLESLTARPRSGQVLLTGSDVGREQQFDRYVGRLQERYGFDRERAVKELRRRLPQQRRLKVR